MADYNPVILSRATSAVTDIERPKLHLRAERAIGFAKIRILGAQSDSRFTQITELAAPARGKQHITGEIAASWLAPDEWLLSGPEQLVAEHLMRIERLAPSDCLAVDITHARAAFLLSGSSARQALAAHCPLDLWEGNFPIHTVARSLLGSASMFLTRLEDLSGECCFRIVVDQTMATFVSRMIGGSQSPQGATA